VVDIHEGEHIPWRTHVRNRAEDARKGALARPKLTLCLDRTTNPGGCVDEVAVRAVFQGSRVQLEALIVIDPKPDDSDACVAAWGPAVAALRAYFPISSDGRKVVWYSDDVIEDCSCVPPGTPPRAPDDWWGEDGPHRPDCEARCTCKTLDSDVCPDDHFQAAESHIIRRHGSLDGFRISPWHSWQNELGEAALSEFDFQRTLRTWPEVAHRSMEALTLRETVLDHFNEDGCFWMTCENQLGYEACLIDLAESRPMSYIKAVYPPKDGDLSDREILEPHITGKTVVWAGDDDG